MATLGERIERARKARGMSKRKLEDAAQLSKGYASRLTKNERDQIGPDVLGRLADALRVSYEWLVLERGEMEPPVAVHPALERGATWPMLRDAARARLAAEVPERALDELLDQTGRVPIGLAGSTPPTVDDVVDVARVLYALRLRARARAAASAPPSQ